MQRLNKSAAYYPLSGGGRQASYYDPKTQKFQLIETCYSTHHLQFDNDPDETVYFNELSGPTFGWIDSKVYDQTLAATKDEIKAEQAAVGWCPQVIDTNGDGKITKPWQTAPRSGFDNLLYVNRHRWRWWRPSRCSRTLPAAAAPAAPAAPAAGAAAAGTRRWPRQPVHRVDAERQPVAVDVVVDAAAGCSSAAPVAFNPQQDTLLANGGYSLYSVIPSPADDSVWGVAETFPGYLIRLTSRQQSSGNLHDPDLQGAVTRSRSSWRRYRQQRRGLDGSGRQQPSGKLRCSQVHEPERTAAKKSWTAASAPTAGSCIQTTGPKFQGTDIPTEFHYFNWTDQQGASGFPPNTPNGYRIQLRLDPGPDLPAGSRDSGSTLRVPYPLGFYARGLDARNDDPQSPATGFTGWKNRAIWSNYGTHFVWHIEGGKGVKGKEVKFQVRPNPLAR